MKKCFLSDLLNCINKIQLNIDVQLKIKIVLNVIIGYFGCIGNIPKNERGQ